MTTAEQFQIRVDVLRVLGADAPVQPDQPAAALRHRLQRRQSLRVSAGPFRAFAQEQRHTVGPLHEFRPLLPRLVRPYLFDFEADDGFQELLQNLQARDVLAHREHAGGLIGRVREVAVRLEVLGHVDDAPAVDAGKEADPPAAQGFDQDRVPALRLREDAGLIARSRSF